MLEKDVVDVCSVNDETMFKTKTKKFRDPTPKMKLRHEQVKERANRRKIAWKNANLKKINKKTVEEEARKQLQREEKQRLDNMKREEDEIRKEMVKIRRVMQEENVQRAKQYTRKIESEEKATKLAKEDVRKHQEENEEKLKRDNEAKEVARRKLLIQQEQEEYRQRQDLKLLQSCFSSWYALVVNKQIKCGKARALLEWRRKLRIWNAWRTYVLRSRSERETRSLNEEMKERHRKEVLADRFYRQILFHRCLSAWLSWVEKAKEDRALKEQHDKRAEKITTLLKAAASGQLCQDQNVEEETGSDVNPVEELDGIPSKPYEVTGIERNSGLSKSRKENPPRQAWPHETLREMKARNPKKKQNALLEGIASKTTQPENSKKAMQGEDNLPIENTSKHQKKDSQPKLSSYKKNEEKIQSHDPPSNTEINDKKYINTEVKVNTEHSIKRESDTCITKKKGLAVEALQSSRSTSSAESKSKVISKKPPTKPLHLAMEERAKARAERKSLMDAKKRAVEEEKLAKLKKEQEEKEREILAEKQAALQKKREEIKLTKQREIEKQQRLNEIKEMNRKADEHYHRMLLRNFGFLPWKKLILIKREMLNNAEVFCNRNLQGSCFRNWLAYTRSECKRRNHLADNLYKSSLVRSGWKSWRKYRNHLAEMDRIAQEFSKRFVAKKYIKIWQDYVIEERLMYWDKENRADEHSDKRLLRKTMTYWKKYIPLLREDEKREKRRSDLRKHVLSLLPDFQTSHHSP
ncbi:coiled-coil domain-containing protein 191-like isoform X2 [Dendronephthya gigantea]|nr:coiled-coil domain-containing protein 191-like isoform X2 [Dendronephthya gigantea]